MTPAERSLLLALFRWARAEGLEYGTTSWWCHRTGPREDWWGVDFNVGDECMTIWRGRMTGRSYFVASVTEAVDLVVALGMVPARFSAAYRAGWDAACGAARPASEWARVLPVVAR